MNLRSASLMLWHCLHMIYELVICCHLTLSQHLRVSLLVTRSKHTHFTVHQHSFREQSVGKWSIPSMSFVLRTWHSELNWHSETENKFLSSKCISSFQSKFVFNWITLLHFSQTIAPVMTTKNCDWNLYLISIQVEMVGIMTSSNLSIKCFSIHQHPGLC